MKPVTDLSLIQKLEGGTAGLLEPGNINLNNRPVVRNPDGSISTVRSMSANIDGREVLMPTVSDDGRILSEQDAINQYRTTGRHLGKFDRPENATAYAQQLHGDQERQYARQPVTDQALISRLESATPEQQAMTTTGARALRGAKDTALGVTQLTSHFADSIPIVGPLARGIRGAIGLPSTQELDQHIASDEQGYQEARKATGQTGMDWARLVGNVASSAPVGLATVPAKGATMAIRALTGGASAGAAAATQPVTEGDYGTEKAKQIALGAGFGGASAPVGGVLGRLIKPNTSPEVKLLMDAGVTPTAGQLAGGALQKAESKLTSVPIIGDAIAGAQRKGVKDFNLAAYGRALEPIGGKIPDEPGRSGVMAVRQQLSSAYDKLLPNLQFKADQQLGQELATVQAMASTLPQQQATRFENILREQVIAKLTPQGNASGESFKTIESELSRLAKLYKGSSVADDRLLADALTETLSSMRKTLIRANPAQAEALSKINEGWANYALIRRAAGSQGAKEGVFTPAMLAAAVKAGDKSTGKGAYAEGRAFMQDLTDAGKKVLGDSYPDSGTAGRLGLMALGAGGAYAYDPQLAATLGLAAIPFLPGARNALAAAATQRPQGANALANRVRQAIPVMGGIGAPAAYQGARN